MDPSKVTHHAEAIAKCPTIRLGVSDECFTYCNPGANMNECLRFERRMHAPMDSHLLELTMETGLDSVSQMHESSVAARMVTVTSGQ